MFLFLFSALRLLPALAQFVIVGSVIAVIGGGLAAIHHSIFQSGVEWEKAQVEAVNQKADDNAYKLKSKADDCANRGRVWSMSRGVCVDP